MQNVLTLQKDETRKSVNCILFLLDALDRKTTFPGLCPWLLLPGAIYLGHSHRGVLSETDRAARLRWPCSTHSGCPTTGCYQGTLLSYSLLPSYIVHLWGWWTSFLSCPSFSCPFHFHFMLFQPHLTSSFFLTPTSLNQVTDQCFPQQGLPGPLSLTHDLCHFFMVYRLLGAVSFPFMGYHYQIVNLLFPTRWQPLGGKRSCLVTPSMPTQWIK